MKRLVLLLLIARSWAACPAGYTPIVDTLTDPVNTGTARLFTGTVVISPVVPTSTGAITFDLTSATLRISGGAFSTCVIPNDAVSPAGTSYAVRYTYALGTWAEIWVVPTSTPALTIRAVRASIVPSTTVMFAPQQISQGGATFNQVLMWNGLSWSPGATAAGATIPHVTNIIKGDGAGNGADSGIASANVLQNGGPLGTPSSGTLTNATGLPNAGLVGLIGLPHGALNLDLSGTGGAHFFMRQNSLGGQPDVVQPSCADLSNASAACSSLSNLSLIAPSLGAATATSVNKITLTSPNTAWTLQPAGDNQTTTIPGGTLLASGGALGTPSSATLTNATGLPTTALTGALQAAQEPAHTGDMTNSAGSLVTTVSRINGTAFAGTTGNTVCFGSSNTPVDCGVSTMVQLTGSFSQAQIVALTTTPVTLVTAQGSGVLIIVDSFVLEYVGGTAYTAGNQLNVGYAGGTQILNCSSNIFTASTSMRGCIANSATFIFTSTSVNSGITFSATTTPFACASTCGTANWWIKYHTVTGVQ